MKLSSAIFLLTLLTVLAVPERAQGQNQTDAKIRLMAEALTARDHGDFTAAREKFEALQAIVPNDNTVRRLLAELDSRIAAEQAARLAPPPSAEPTVATVSSPEPVLLKASESPASKTEVSSPASVVAPAVPPPRDAVMPLVTDEKPSGAPETNAPAPKKDPYTEVSARIAAAAAALAQSEAVRLDRMGAYLEAQRELARLYAHDGNYAAAVRTLDAALGVLQTPVKELQAERERYAQQERALLQGPRVRTRR